jgi:hypothetical protein
MITDVMPKGRSGMKGGGKTKAIGCITKITALPGEKSRTASAPKEEAEETTVTAEDLATIATEVVLECVIASKNGVSKKALLTKVFQNVQDSGDQQKVDLRTKIWGLANDDTWLGSGPWEFDGETLTTAE